jgi:Domain of unknown function (DUF3127)
MHYFMIASIKSIGETQKFGDTFQKREFIVETDEQYPETLKLEFTNEQCDALDSYIEGEVVTIAFIPKGNEYQGKHYVQLRAIAISGADDKFVDKQNKKAKTLNKATQKLVEELRKANKVEA